MGERVFFYERIAPILADGYEWLVEVRTGRGFNQRAVGGALTKWGARRAIRAHKRRMIHKAIETMEEDHA